MTRSPITFPTFGSHGKGEITLLQVLTHQGGFPGAGMDIPRSAWEDHDRAQKPRLQFHLGMDAGLAR